MLELSSIGKVYHNQSIVHLSHQTRSRLVQERLQPGLLVYAKSDRAEASLYHFAVPDLQGT